MFTKFPNLIFSCFFFFYTVFRILSSINKVRIYHEARIKGRYVLNGRKLSVQRFTLNTFLFHHFFFFLHLFFSRFLSSSSHLLFHLHSLSSSLSSLLWSSSISLFSFFNLFFFSPISGTLLFRLFSRFTVIYFAGLLHCMEKYGFIRMLFNKGNTLYDYILCICVSECVCRVHARAHAHTCIICKIYMHARRSCVYTILNVCTNHFNLSKRQIQYS